MSISLSLIDFQKAQAELKKAMKDFAGGKVVTVGIHEEAGNVEDGNLTMASLGAVHEFGADIDHPGGTSYGYATQAAAEKGQVRFLKSGTGFLELGVTQPHKIEIPARPWLNPGVLSASKEILATIEDQIGQGKTLDETLEAVGVVASGQVRVYMTELKTPPNAASTIKKKGSANPLIDSGAMRASVTHQVASEPVEEGL